MQKIVPAQVDLEAERHKAQEVHSPKMSWRAESWMKMGCVFQFDVFSNFDLQNKYICMFICYSTLSNTYIIYIYTYVYYIYIHVYIYI